tara:strand:+ start:6527 stop:6700 length:174 start_codon:yes stop_codon:yes gene_type:complete
MTSYRTLTQADIDKIIKETEQQIANEPVYEKPIKENEKWEILGYNLKTKTLKKVLKG